MGNKFSGAIIGLSLLCASQGLAGTTGNGADQRNGTAPVAKTHYSYCFGGLRKTVYFSNVIESAPTVAKPDLGIPFGAYLTKTFGVGSNDGGQCITSEVMADIANAKKQREAEFVAKTWKIIETKWSGLGAP
jgi:hypothetical protein